VSGLVLAILIVALLLILAAVHEGRRERRQRDSFDEHVDATSNGRSHEAESVLAAVRQLREERM
jgi:hypothetical protein